MRTWSRQRAGLTRLGSQERMGAAVRELVIAGVLIVLLIAVVMWGTIMGPRAPGSSTEAVRSVSTSGSAPDPAAVARGREAYSMACIACHGENGEARPGLGKDIANSEFVASLNDGELVAFLKKGRDPGDPLNTTGIGMPPKGGNPAITDAQLNDIVAFIRELQASH